MRLFLTAAIVGLSVSTAATAAAAADPVEDKVICKRQYANDTGSNFRSSKRICLKRSEWKEQERETEMTVRKINDSGGGDQTTVVRSGGPN